MAQHDGWSEPLRRRQGPWEARRGSPGAVFRGVRLLVDEVGRRRRGFGRKGRVRHGPRRALPGRPSRRAGVGLGPPRSQQEGVESGRDQETLE